MSAAPGWSMQVRDAAGRTRDLEIKVSDGEMVLTVPPPGVARIKGPEIQRLIYMASEARRKLFEQDATPPERPGR